MRRFSIVLHLYLVLVSTLLLHAQDFTALASFDGSNGYMPSGALVQANDGNLYGVTAEGGTFGLGTLYQVTLSGTLTTGFSFNLDSPSGRLLPTPGGYFFGTTTGQIAATGYLFQASETGIAEAFPLCTGCIPRAGLVGAPEQNTYGTAASGGSGACSDGCGFVYTLYGFSYTNPLHQFNGTDGANPRGELLQAGDGNLYGTTVNGGNSNCQDGCGTIFKITPNGDFTSLYQFCSQTNCADGANPYGALVQGADGNLYGTTSAGGNDGVNCSFTGCGTIFKVSLDGKLTTLYSFCDDFFCPTGANPQSGLILGTDGNYYGTAYGGGDVTLGTLFRITPQGKLSLLHTFAGDDGAYPTSALLQASDGKFYGVTTQGSTGYGGTLFKMEIDFNAALFVTKSGNGTITSDDSKIQCGAVCSANYESGDVVTLTATPDQQWGFVSWTGCDGVQANVCTVTMNHARSVAATFQPAYPLVVSEIGNGAITSNDGFISCGQTCSHTYLVWSYVLLTAVPDQGWVLTGWTGCDQSNGTVCSVTMNKARNVSATFKFLYHLAVSKSGSGLVIGDGGIYCGSTCSASYPDGSMITLTGIPNPGYTMVWSGCDNVQGNVCTVHLSAARNVTATFSQSSVTLTSLVVKPAIVKGGKHSGATVTLSRAAPPGGVGIAMSTDHPEVVHLPSQVVVPGGRNSVNITVQTFAVHAETVAKLTASAGLSHVSATLTVMPLNWRGQMTVAGNDSDTEATIAESDLAAESSLRGGRSLSAGNDMRPPQAAALLPPPADPSDERKEYPVQFVGAVEPGEYNGVSRPVPHVGLHDSLESELMVPADRVHHSAPPLPPANTLMASVGPMPQPLISFPGMSLQGNCWGGWCGTGYPPDTTGAVGLQYYMQAINTTFAVFDKNTGALVFSFPEGEFFDWNSACSANATGDPTVLYDATADRWVLSFFAFTDSQSGPFYQCFAVSASGDPHNANWHTYSIQTDQNPVPAGMLNDYSKIAIWNDGCLYMGSDGYLADSYSGQVILSVSLADMYSGNPARYSLSFLSGSANFALFPATMLGKGNNLPPPSEAEYYVQESLTSDAFNIRTISPGSCVSGGSLSGAVAVPHDTYNSFSQNIVPQPPPANGGNDLDTIHNVLMQWVQYRKVGATESLWVNHTTYVTNSNTSPQWAQIDVTGGNINTSLVQQQIYRPDSNLFRWLGSLAVDSFGDMAMCYSTSNGTAPNFPSIQCAGRLATDPLGQLPQGETEYVAGGGSQVINCGPGVCHRWGDYSSTTIDPVDDCTFWHTNMFYPDQASGSSGNFSTQIVAFRYPNCVTPPATLNVTKSGSGTVSSLDGFINCGPTCSYSYNVYAQVTLQQTAAPGWLFSGWSGCDSGDEYSCSLTLYGNRSVTATFTQGVFSLFASEVGTGSGTITSSDGYINCGPTCSHDYLGGTVVTLTGSPAQGSRFDGWNGCDNVQNNVCTVSITGYRSVSATFNLQGNYRLAVQKLGSGIGTVTSTDGHINCGSACFFDYNPGDNVTLTAKVEHGSVLSGWVGCDQVQNGSCYLKMGEVRNVTAKIDIATYALAVTKSGSGTVSSGDGYINCGATCSYLYLAWSYVVLTAVPGQGWGLTGWSGCDRSDGNVCTVTMNNARNVSATFKALYSLTVATSGSGLVIGDGGIYCGLTCSGAYPDGSNVSMTGLPSPGYTIGWSGCDNVQGNVCTVVMSSARNLTATFTLDQVTLSSLAFNPSSVRGGQLTAGTLTLSGPAPPGGVSVAISSDHPAVVHPPSSVLVPGGKTSVSFAVNTFPVKTKTSVVITATAGSSQTSGGLTVDTSH